MAQETPSVSELDPVALEERDAARYMNFSSAYMRLSRREGRGPAFVRVGRTVRYLRSDLDAWLARHRVETRESRAQSNALGRPSGARA